MEWVWTGIGLVLGIALGWAWGASRSRQAMEPTLRELEVRARVAENSLNLVENAASQLTHTFKALAADALRHNNEGFLALARTDHEARQKALEGLVNPVKESLQKVDQQIRDLEKARAEAYGTLSSQVRSLILTQEKLQQETGNLVKALRAPNVRGRWGEIQLKRVVELAGMLEHCDFYQQQTVWTEEGRLRPDVVVRLPGGKHIVIDAKAPFQAYLESLEAETDEERLGKLKDHARQIRHHLTKLSAKSYWDQFDATPEFVILFLAGEVFFSAALEHDPSLIEEGVHQRVLIATPTTLIALLRAAHYGWRQEQIAENALHISELGRELADRVAIMAEHIGRVGGALEKSVEAFNAAVASFEGRVLPSARKFRGLGLEGKREVGELTPIERAVRTVSATAEEDSEVSE